MILVVAFITPTTANKLLCHSQVYQIKNLETHFDLSLFPPQWDPNTQHSKILDLYFDTPNYYWIPQTYHPSPITSINFGPPQLKYSDRLAGFLAVTSTYAFGTLCIFQQWWVIIFPTMLSHYVSNKDESLCFRTVVVVVVVVVLVVVVVAVVVVVFLMINLFTFYCNQYMDSLYSFSGDDTPIP